LSFGARDVAGGQKKRVNPAVRRRRGQPGIAEKACCDALLTSRRRLCSAYGP
jgi:hypothetical protein